MKHIHPTNIEKTFGVNELIVSRTSLTGIIEYCNHTFIDISGYTEHELLGKPHSVIRHPDMPRSVFKLLWETISAGNEIFAYVKNLCKGGEYYWVIAHITPTFDTNSKVIGYHSNRRYPEAKAIKHIEQLYQELLLIERKGNTMAEGLQNSYNHLLTTATKNGEDYNEFILNL